MGLLDDAIRDHLELKRLRGADPGLVAREQKEALDPVFGEEHAAQEVLPEAPDDRDPEATSEMIPVRATSTGDPDTAPRPASPDFANVGQETAELDMRTVLDEHQDGAAEQASPDGPAVVGPVGGARSVEDRDEDSLEWEVPERDSTETPAEAGQHVPYTQRPSGP